MIVSNFEIGVKTSARNADRSTTYQLQITNLEDKEIGFAIETHVAKSQDGTPPLDILSARLLYNPTYPTLTPAWRSGGAAWVDAHTFSLGTGLSAVFELGIRPILAGESHDQTLLGHVVLRVPPMRRAGQFHTTVQSAGPVRVLLTASRFDTRGFFQSGARDVTGVTQLLVSGNDLFSSQSIPISTGRAENEIEAEGLTIENVVRLVDKLRAGSREPTAAFARGALLMPEDERLPALVDLLSGLSRDEEGLVALNDLLAEISASVRIRPA